MIDIITSYTYIALDVLTKLFIFCIGLGILFIVVVFIRDVTQTKQAIRRNYPVVAHFRYFFESLGKFFRQYFFSMDREEMPFNRAQRTWVYQASKNIDTTQAFGSTRNITEENALLFVNSPYPSLNPHRRAEPIIIGEEYCDKPYKARSVFNISGMSYGALSKPAVLALSKGAKMGRCWQNTGEGGLSPYHLEGGADLVFQIGTAKYGCRDDDGNLSDQKLKELAAHEQVRMFEIKLSQGAKPGKGGILPAIKVTQEISEIRGIPMHTDSLSPNRHLDIHCVDDLLDMILRIRKVTGKPVGFKTVIGDDAWIREVFDKINERGPESAPDFITIDSADGGTGAAPLSLIDYVGMPISDSLPMVVDILHETGLRDRIKVVCSGKMINPAEATWALCVGADFVVSARGFMFALGCIQALHCNRNTCPTGITTHKAHLQRGLVPKEKAERVAHYLKNMIHEMEVIAHSCGIDDLRDLERHHCRIVQSNGRSIRLDKLLGAKVG